LSGQIAVGVDIMGSDTQPEELLAALLPLASRLAPSVSLVAIGRPELATQAIRYVAAPDEIRMDDPPLVAIKRKKHASMLIGLRMLKERRISAFVSAGNTGALVSGAKMVVGTLPSVRRPALIALFPTKKGPLAVIDVGANIEADHKLLVQFAHLGAAYQRARQIVKPTVGLLNIGAEPIKGKTEQRLAYAYLTDHPSPLFTFCGNVEGKSVFDGHVDVLVSDGFTGNVFLKTAEGIGSLLIDQLQAHLPPNTPFATTLEQFTRHLHHSHSPGALLAGLKGLVVKCHGYASPDAFASAVAGAAQMAASGFLETLEKELKHLSRT
jgi:glycerol-3-phosphate acyltransferase PlsX